LALAALALTALVLTAQILFLALMQQLLAVVVVVSQ
jgi:hypothetical protein